MAKPRKSIEHLKSSGSYRPGKHKSREKPVATTGEPRMPPGRVPRDAQWVWRLIVKSLPAGLLSPLDAIALEMLCRWWSCWDSAMASGDIGTAAKAFSCLERTASKFGLSPRDRLSLQIPKPNPATDEADPFELLKLVRGD